MIPFHPSEIRVLRTAACAALEPGLAVSVHLQRWGRTGNDVVDILLAEGLPPERVALGHLNTAGDDRPDLRSLAERGVKLVFGLFGFDHSLVAEPARLHTVEGR